MQRLDFIKLLGGAAVAWPGGGRGSSLSCRGRQTPELPRYPFLSTTVGGRRLNVSTSAGR
jgi:hypothetical protein